jgi:hypothetical protein
VPCNDEEIIILRFSVILIFYVIPATKRQAYGVSAYLEVKVSESSLFVSEQEGRNPFLLLIGIK